MNVNQYPLPRIEDNFDSLSGGQHFSKIGLSPLYCGHEVHKEGIWKTKDKIDAVLKIPAPENVTQLRSFLGLVKYYNRFLSNLASELKPLNKLLEKGQKWIWNEIQQTAFAKAKNLISSDTVLTHYDPNKELFLAWDASPYGVLMKTQRDRSHRYQRLLQKQFDRKHYQSIGQ